jgi:hypothetical protein
MLRSISNSRSMHRTISSANGEIGAGDDVQNLSHK